MRERERERERERDKKRERERDKKREKRERERDKDREKIEKLPFSFHSFVPLRVPSFPANIQTFSTLVFTPPHSLQ
jgi:hypothetical protein